MSSSMLASFPGLWTTALRLANSVRVQTVTSATRKLTAPIKCQNVIT